MRPQAEKRARAAHRFRREPFRVRLRPSSVKRCTRDPNEEMTDHFRQPARAHDLAFRHPAVTGRWVGFVAYPETVLSFEFRVTEIDCVVEGTASFVGGSPTRARDQRPFLVFGVRHTDLLHLQLRHADHTDIDVELRLVAFTQVAGRVAASRLVGRLWIGGDRTKRLPISLDRARAAASR
jgi:hypothetical protein